MKTYRYAGPLTGVTLKDGAEVLLHDGGLVELPPDNGYVKTLIARGRLTEEAKPRKTKAEKEIPE